MTIDNHLGEDDSQIDLEQRRVIPLPVFATKKLHDDIMNALYKDDIERYRQRKIAKLKSKVMILGLNIIDSLGRTFKL